MLARVATSTQKHHLRLPQQETPKPKAKMRSLNWNKIPVQRVMAGNDNIWSLVAKDHVGYESCTNIDFDEIECLFSQPVPSQGSPKLGRDVVDGKIGQANEVDKRKREEITLLDSKRSLNINIFLKQFRSSNEEIITLIHKGSHFEIGAEKLRGLLKILPESDEVEMLKSFNGDTSRLGNAEKFLLHLLSVSRYKLRIEGMLLKEEFTANLNYLEPAINAMIQAANDLKTNKRLQEVLFMVLVAGNFINAGGYAGDAAGFRMTSLQKLTDIRANKPGMNLIHYVAQQAERKDITLLSFPDELIRYLEDATKVSIDQLKGDIMAMDQRITQLQSQVQNAEGDIEEQMAGFLEYASNECTELQAFLGLLEQVRKELCEFFCEDVQTFKLEECYKIFYNFCTKFKAAIEENKKRCIQEAKAEIRRRQREEQLAKKKFGLNGDQVLTPASGSEGETTFFESLMADGRGSRRFGEGSFNIRKVKKTNLDSLNGSFTSEDEPSITSSPRVARRTFSNGNTNGGGDGSQESPDVTPTGTLRNRRRARLPSEEADENLMDFLRHSSAENEARERRSWNSVDSYGSLDRSFGRRSRRKRPDLLGVEFMDRERPASPGLLTLPSPTCDPASTSESESKSSKLKQKIEAWLETDDREKQAKEQERRKKPQPKNAFTEDVDAGGRSVLHTLHEDGGQDAEVPSYAERWKSSVAPTNIDVSRAIEVVEGAQVKDKSAWRKSTLNVPNTTEPVDDARQRARRARSQSNIEGSQVNTALQAIRPLGGEGDTLRLYFRSPSQDTLTTQAGQGDASSFSGISMQRRNSEPTAKEDLDSRASAVANLSKRDDAKQSVEGLHPIIENDYEKHMAADLRKATAAVAGDDGRRDTSEIYSRTPSGATIIHVDGGHTAKANPVDSPRLTRRYSRTPSSEQDADSENVETPPTPRRVRRQPSVHEDHGKKPERKSTDYGSLRAIHKKPPIATTRKNNLDGVGDHQTSGRSIPVVKDDDLGDGQFDRFASIRRSRRLRRSADHGEASGKKDESEKPKLISHQVSRIDAESTQIRNSTPSRQLQREDPLQQRSDCKSVDGSVLVRMNSSENERRDIDDAVRNIEKVGHDLKVEMERNALDAKPTAVGKETTFGGSASRINAKTEEEIVTSDYEKVTTRRSSKGMPSLSRIRSRPANLPLMSVHNEDGGGEHEKTFTSTLMYTPTSPERESTKSPSPPLINLRDLSSAVETINPIHYVQSTSVRDAEDGALTSLASMRLRQPFKSSEKARNSRPSSFRETEPDEGFEELQSLGGGDNANHSAPYASDFTSEPPSLSEEQTDLRRLSEPDVQESDKAAASQSIESFMRTTPATTSLTGGKTKPNGVATRRRSSGGNTQLQRRSPFNSRNSLASNASKKRAGSNLSLRSSHSSLSIAPAKTAPSYRRPIVSTANNRNQTNKITMKTAPSTNTTTADRSRQSVNGFAPTVHSTGSTRIPKAATTKPQRQLSLPRQTSTSKPSVRQPVGTGLRRSESHSVRSVIPRRPATVVQNTTPPASVTKIQVNRSPSSTSSSSSSTHKENGPSRDTAPKRAPLKASSARNPAIRTLTSTPSANNSSRNNNCSFMRATTSSQAKKSVGDTNPTRASQRSKLPTSTKSAPGWPFAS